MAGLVLLLCVSPGWAGDWTVKTNLSETLSLNDNERFVVDPEGYTIGSNSRITLDAVARSYVYEFLLNGSLGYQSYFGTAADIPADRLLPSLATSYVRKGKTDTFTVGANYTVDPNTDDNEGLEEESDSSGFRQNMSVNTTVVHKIDPRNELNFSANASRVDFIDGGEDDEPNSSLGASGTWRHRATKRTDFSLTGGTSWIAYENDESEQSLYSFVRVGTTTQLRKRLSAAASVGPSATMTYRDEVPPNSGRDSETDYGALADLSFTYLHKDGTFTGSASYGLKPDENNDLENSLSFALGYSHRINDRSNFQISTRYSISDSAEDGEPASSTFSISPSYTYTPARDWQLIARYQFALKNSDDGEDEGIAIQNAFFLTLSRNYTLLP